MRPTWDELFVEFVQLVAKRSTCRRVQVGAIAVKDNRVIGTGYNGVGPGEMHCIEAFKAHDPDSEEFRDIHGKFSRKYEIHAEANLVAFLARNTISSEGATIYLTHSPCQDCAKLLHACRIERLVYIEKYDRDTEGLDYLENCGIVVEQYESSH